MNTNGKNQRCRLSGMAWACAISCKFIVNAPVVEEWK